MDPYGFKPLEPALHDLLLGLNHVHDDGRFLVFDGDDYHTYKELETLGYMSDVSMDFTQSVGGFVTTKGRRYEDDFRDWEERRASWLEEERQRQEDERVKATRHDWGLNIVNGIYALAAAAVGAAVGFFLGRM